MPKLIGTQITSISRENNSYLYKVILIATASDDHINLNYHKIGSEIQKNLFPEIILGSVDLCS